MALENKDYQQRLNAVHVKNAADQKRLAAIAIVTQQDVLTLNSTQDIGLIITGEMES